MKTNDITIESEQLLQDNLSTISVKAVRTISSPLFKVLKGKIEENGEELYTLTQKNSCKPWGKSWPDDAQIFAGEQLVGEISHVESRMCCDRVTTHEVSMHTPAGKSAVSQIVFDLPKCKSELAVTASPFFKSPPTRYCFITFIMALIATGIFAGNLHPFFAINWVIGTVIASVVTAVWVVLLVIVCYKRGCTNSQLGRRKFLELYNTSDGTLAAIISKYCPTCATACCRGDYEIQLLQPMDLPKTLTLIGIALRLHWAMRFLEA